MRASVPGGVGGGGSGGRLHLDGSVPAVSRETVISVDPVGGRMMSYRRYNHIVGNHGLAAADRSQRLESI